MNNNKKTKTHLRSALIFVPEIRLALNTKDVSTLSQVLRQIHPVDLADIWNEFAAGEQLTLFKLLPQSRKVELFEELDFSDQKFLLENLEDENLTPVLREMSSDEKASFVKELSPQLKKKLLTHLRQEEVKKIDVIMKYPANTAASIMNVDYISLTPQMNARKALETVQNLSRLHRMENLYAFYVLDEENHLLGGITLRRLIALPPDTRIAEAMTPVKLIALSPEMSLEQVAEIFSRYDLNCAPVVDNENKLLGIIVIDDVVDIINRLNTKEVYEIGKMAAEGGEIISYEKATIKELFRRRFGWLVALLVFDFLTGTVLKTFEHALSTVVALTFFIPMLLDTGGNAGAQASITIIRGLATGDVNFKNIWRIIKLEILTALLMGLGVGLVAFGRSWLLQRDLLLGITVGFTMFCLIILAISTGIFLPLISKKIGLDPAVLAGPITTSVVDVCGLIIYFKVAQVILPVLK